MFKDTLDGQTHYQNDGCGEPAHNNPFTAFMKEERDEIVEKYSHLTDDLLQIADGRKSFKDWNDVQGRNAERLQDFLSSHDQRLIEKVVEMVEGMKKEEIIKLKCTPECSERHGYNQALTDLLSSLQDIKSK